MRSYQCCATSWKELATIACLGETLRNRLKIPSTNLPDFLLIRVFKMMKRLRYFENNKRSLKEIPCKDIYPHFLKIFAQNILNWFAWPPESYSLSSLSDCERDIIALILSTIMRWKCLLWIRNSSKITNFRGVLQKHIISFEVTINEEKASN